MIPHPDRKPFNPRAQRERQDVPYFSLHNAPWITYAHVAICSNTASTASSVFDRHLDTQLDIRLHLGVGLALQKPHKAVARFPLVAALAS